MNILVTAGGTSENIDDVRKICNMATGRLGSFIAESFLEDDKTFVTYVCSRSAAKPQNPRARILLIDDVRSLQDAIENEMQTTTYDAVVHSMAVSDFTVKYRISSEDLTEHIAEAVRGGAPEHLEERIHSALLEYGGVPKTGKISSEIGNLFLCLEKTPKIIGLFKKHQPRTVLVGFKLLSGVEENELLRAAEGLMQRNGCDFVLANDLKNVRETRHEAMLLGRDHSVVRMGTKQEIASVIRKCVVRKIGEGRPK